MKRMNKMIDPQCYKTSCARYEGISLKLKKINNEACNSDVYLHCEEGKSSSGESSWASGDGGEPKSKLGKTPGGLSRGSIESNWLESPTTSAHP